jgi:hypothetical protein
MATRAKQKLYKTETTLRRKLRVFYPALMDDSCCAHCWTGTKMWKQFRRARTVISEDFNSKRISLSLYFKPCLVRDGEFHWAVGPNKLLLMKRMICEFPTLASSVLRREHSQN